MTLSHADSTFVLLSALFVSCRSTPALIFTFLLVTAIIISVIVMETIYITLIIKAVARELIDIMYALLVLEFSMPNVFCGMVVFTLIW